MKKEISVRTISDDSLWDAFVAASPQGTVFSKSAWLKAAADMQGATPVRLGAWQDGVLTAGVSFVEVSRGGFRKAVSPMLSPYGGLLYDGAVTRGEHGDTSSSLILLAEQLIGRLERRYHQIMLSHSPVLFDIRPFTWKHWETQVRYTYRLDITDAEAALKRFKTRVRSRINRTARIMTVNPAGDSAVAGDLHEQAFQRQGERPPFSGAQFATMLDRLREDNLVEILEARDSTGNPGGVQVNALGSGVVNTLFYGATDQYRQSGVDAFLIHDAVVRYSPSYRRLDLLGANIPNIAFFKRGFGGRLTPFYVTERYSSPFARVALTAYTRLRKLMKR